MATTTTTIDEALELLEGTGPEYGGGLANHGPMAAEALFALGRVEAAVPWAENYRRRLQEHPSAGNAIVADEWREALGDGRRVGDWVAFFDRELAASPWRDVLDTWVARLAPALIAAATHGAIRTGHAARSLAAAETPLRLHELAEGLGYWAARYYTLPGAPSGRDQGLAPSQAIERVQPLSPEAQQGAGLITVGLARLREHPAFADTVDLVATGDDASAFISDLTQTFAGVYLANASDFLRTISFIHSVTGPSAVRLIAPHVSPETARAALRYAWQAGAALYAAFGSTPGGAPDAAPDGDIDDLIDRAVATGDEHAIKFTEACLREHALNPKPVYLAAARDAVERLRPR